MRARDVHQSSRCAARRARHAQGGQVSKCENGVGAIRTRHTLYRTSRRRYLSTSRIIDGIYESRIMAGEYHRPCGSNRGQGWRRPERPAEDVQRGGNGRARVGSVDLAPAAGGAAAAAARSDIFGREGQKVGPKESREDRVQLSDASGHRKAPGRGSITWLRERREQRAP